MTDVQSRMKSESPGTFKPTMLYFGYYTQTSLILKVHSNFIARNVFVFTLLPFVPVCVYKISAGVNSDLLKLMP